MSARRYGPQDGQPPQKMSDYHQSKDELAGLPVTTALIVMAGRPDLPH